MNPRKVDKPLVLYGYGKLGKLAIEVFDKLNIHTVSINKDFKSYEITNKEDCLIAVCIATESYEPIKRQLQDEGWQDIVSVYDIFEAYPECGITSGWFTGKLSSADIEGIASVMNNFSDEMSLDHYWEFIAWHKWRDEMDIRITDDRFNIPELHLNDTELVYKPYEGSTLEDISIRKKVIKLAGFPGYPAFSYIQLHCEGFELETIKRNIEYLQAYRPKIAVTCYHTREGLWKIEKYLMSNLSDYNFYFRLHAYCGQVAIIYCVPKEKTGE
jgi:hypothetical protein